MLIRLFGNSPAGGQSASGGGKKLVEVPRFIYFWPPQEFPHRKKPPFPQKCPQQYKNYPCNKKLLNFTIWSIILGVENVIFVPIKNWRCAPAGEWGDAANYFWGAPRRHFAHSPLAGELLPPPGVYSPLLCTQARANCIRHLYMVDISLRGFQLRKSMYL